MSLRKIRIITDSTNDLSPEILNRYDITVVPLYVEFGEASYKDGVELTPKKLFAKVEDGGVLPKTASPSPYDFHKVFAPYIEAGEDLLVITISSEISSTYQNALLAAAQFPAGRIAVVDSRSLSTGIGIVIMAAAEGIHQGMTLDAVAQMAADMTATVHVSFVIETLDYLYKGGRCSAIQSMLGSVLKIKPIIGLLDGKIIVREKVRGDKKRVVDKMLSEAVAQKEKIDPERLIVSYSAGSEQEAAYLKERLAEQFPDSSIHITEAGCVISSHCGPKTVSIVFVTR